MRSTIGRYRIVSELGRGGMGIVYKAHDPRIDRVVAIKTIRKDRYTGEESESRALARFEREARAAGKLTHPGIVTIYDVAEDGDELYLTMEFVEGVSLRSKMEQAQRFALAEAVHVLAQVCDALGYAHSRGVVHRDVKPDNILCLADGTVKLADFGIARLATATATHTAIGTPRYMAPEQWRGADVDGRTDLFAVGVMLHELLTGAGPFTARSTTQLMYVVLNDPPSLPTQIDPSLPKAVDTVVQRALCRDPSGRYRSGNEFARALEQLVGEAAAAAPAEAVRLTILRRGDVHFVDLAETGTLIPRSETRVDTAFMEELAGEVERLAAGRVEGRGAETLADTTGSAPTLGYGSAGGYDEDDRVSGLQAIGRLVYSHLLTEPARRKISASTGGDLYLRLDEQLVHVPWELCYDGHEFLATKFRIGRQVITDRPIPQRSAASTSGSGQIEILLVTDPTETLGGARDECAAIEAQLATAPEVRVTRLAGKSVRKMVLLQALGRSTIVHFAGHSIYDGDDPTRSGWVLSDGVLTAGEMTKLDRLPQLVFSNSCHAGATVGWDGRSSYEGHAFGIGSAFLLAGVPNYLGTFWVTHDEESALFARAFYQSMLRGAPIGESMQAARRRVVDQCGWNELTWASYMLYGDPAYRLPIRKSSPVRPASVIEDRPPPPVSEPEIERSSTSAWARPKTTMVDAVTAPRPAKAPGRAWMIIGGAVLLVLAALVGWLVARQDAPVEKTPPLPTVVASAAPVATPTVVEKTPTPVPSLTPTMPVKYRIMQDTLDAPDVALEKKVEVIEELAKDRNDWATKVLLSGSDHADRLVAMAAIGALSGRSCEQIRPALAVRLGDPEPGKRAYAAKTLGDTGCADALEALYQRRKVEADQMVLDNLKAAIEKLVEK